jgi:hypothetical protein
MLLIFIPINPEEKKVGLLKKLKMLDLLRPLPGSRCSLLLANLGGDQNPKTQNKIFWQAF